METDHIESTFRRILLYDCIELHWPLGNKTQKYKGPCLFNLLSDFHPGSVSGDSEAVAAHHK